MNIKRKLVMLNMHPHYREKKHRYLEKYIGYNQQDWKMMSLSLLHLLYKNTVPFHTAFNNLT